MTRGRVKRLWMRFFSRTENFESVIVVEHVLVVKMRIYGVEPLFDS
jgi:hypothetical protein